jgi:hypothetical protein
MLNGGAPFKKDKASGHVTDRCGERVRLIGGSEGFMTVCLSACLLPACPQLAVHFCPRLCAGLLLQRRSVAWRA